MFLLVLIAKAPCVRVSNLNYRTRTSQVIELSIELVRSGLGARFLNRNVHLLILAFTYFPFSSLFPFCLVQSHAVSGYSGSLEDLSQGMVELAETESTSELKFRGSEFEKVRSSKMSILQGVQGPQRDQNTCDGSKMAR